MACYNAIYILVPGSKHKGRTRVHTGTSNLYVPNGKLVFNSTRLVLVLTVSHAGDKTRHPLVLVPLGRMNVSSLKFEV